MKVKVYIFIILLQVFAGANIFAQESDTIKSENIDSLVNSGQICFDPVPENDTIYLYVRQMPEFPGGKLSLRRYIAENTKYPNIQRECAIDGTVFIRFEIKKTGEVGRIELQNGVDPLLDEEAIKVIKSLPRFKPGMKEGKPVNVWHFVPITFKLN